MAIEQSGEKKFSDFQECISVEEGCEEAANQTSSAKESADEDQSRPAESIKGVEPDSVQRDLNESSDSGLSTSGNSETTSANNKIKVKFDRIQINKLEEFEDDCQHYEVDACTDGARNGAEWSLIAYVQGKRVDLLIRNNIMLQHTADQGIIPPLYVKYLQKELTVTISKDKPLSIIVVGYEKDACPSYVYPNEIEYLINEALSHPVFDDVVLLGKYPELKKVETDVNKVNYFCELGQNRHEVFPVINEVYEPVYNGIHYGEGSYEEKSIRFFTNPSYHYIIYQLDYTISLVK